MAQNKFCTSCGAPLSEGQRFCSNCGATTDETPATTPTVQQGVTVPLQGNVAQGAGATRPMPQQPPVASQRVTMAPSQQPKKSSAGKVVAIVVLSVIAVAAIAVGVLFATGVLGGGSQGEVQEQQAEDQTEQAQPTAPAPSARTTYSPGASREEIMLYERLVSFYDELDSYDKTISEDAERFNANCTNDDYSMRSHFASDARENSYEIEHSYSELMALNVPRNSVNANSYNEMLTCYSDCLARIGVIVDAWDISLSTYNPSAYKDEILAPIKRDNDGNGNRYYIDFKNRYPNAKPVMP